MVNLRIAGRPPTAVNTPYLPPSFADAQSFRTLCLCPVPPLGGCWTSMAATWWRWSWTSTQWRKGGQQQELHRQQRRRQRQEHQHKLRLHRRQLRPRDQQQQQQGVAGGPRQPTGVLASALAAAVRALTPSWRAALPHPLPRLRCRQTQGQLPRHVAQPTAPVTRLPRWMWGTRARARTGACPRGSPLALRAGGLRSATGQRRQRRQSVPGPAGVGVRRPQRVQEELRGRQQQRRAVRWDGCRPP